MSSLRHAALAVHAMDSPDRQWLLEQLPTDQRESLQSMLTELGSLGIPANAADLVEFAPNVGPADSGATVHPKTPHAETATPHERLQGADPTDIAMVMSDEPVELLAILLTLGRSEWRQSVLTTLSSAKRAAIETCVVGTPGPALVHALTLSVMSGVDAKRREARSLLPVRKINIFDRIKHSLSRRARP